MFEPSAHKALDGSFNLEKLNSQADTYEFNKPITYNITITNTGDAFLIAGTANAQAKTACSRCLEDVEIEMSATIDAYYLIEAPQDARDNEINEFEILPEDHNIPLGDIIKATLIVDAPTKPLCSEDCKGLCPKCGANLNRETCDCTDEPDSSNPFSVLKSLKL